MVFMDFFGNFEFYQEQIVPKSLKIHQYNLHMKFSTLNVDLNCPSLDPIGSKWPAHEGIKDGYPLPT